MRKLLYCFLLMSLCINCAPKSEKSKKTTKSSAASVELADPFVLYHDGVYYAYGTRSAEGILVYTSSDLESWTLADNGRNGLALHKDDVYGNKQFWAPEVYCIDDQFIMYFSAELRICAATSNSPLGPFIQKEKKPMFVTLPGDETTDRLGPKFCIDNHLFIDDNGKPYIYFVRAMDGLNVWIAELEDDYMTIKEGTVQHCMSSATDEGNWEAIWPRVNEGPFVNKHNGTYYMTYSANSYESPDYALGYATAPHPKGPWVKHPSNPILRRVGDLVGTGHHGNFVDKDGNLRIAFHSHKNDSTIHHRLMHISSVKFVPDSKGGPDLMVIDPDYMTPTIQQ